jgi:hypothetical protein
MEKQQKAKEALPVIKLGDKFEAGPHHFALGLDEFFNHSVEVDEQASTVKELLRTLRSEKVTKVDDKFGGNATFTTDSGVIRVHGDRNVMNTLYRIAELLEAGIDPVQTAFYYYGHDYCTDDPQEAFEFFVVGGGKILSERFVLFTDDIRFLELHKDDDPIWRSHPYIKEADTVFWYRKFYQETRMGQLTVLRPDNPTLYHYATGTGHENLLKEWNTNNRVVSIEFWIGAVILALGWYFLSSEHTFLSAALLLMGLIALDRLGRIRIASSISALVSLSVPPKQ